jgi:photosystem II stability/assembly factor-like uncharacterized protein
MGKSQLSISLRRLLYGTIFFLSLYPDQSNSEDSQYFLNDLCMVNENNGWTVGDIHLDQTDNKLKGTILKTVTGGSLWKVQQAGMVENFHGVTCVDSNNAWVSGENGVLLHTSDGGEHWLKQSIATKDNIRNVKFIDPNYGWATSNEVVLYDDFMEEVVKWHGHVWKTMNGGVSWVEQSLPKNAGYLHGIKFIDRNNGWVVGSKVTRCEGSVLPWITCYSVGAVYHTSNGGATWVEQWASNLDIVMVGVDFVDSLNGWMVGFQGNSGLIGEGTIFHTSNGGNTWVQQENGASEPMNIPGGYASEILWSIDFIDKNKGYVVGFSHGRYLIYQTMDGGNRWVEKWPETLLSFPTSSLYGLAVFNSKLLAVGNNIVVMTDDPWNFENHFDAYNVVIGNMPINPVLNLLFESE